VLDLIAVMRTFLSMALQLELEGRWPWQRVEVPLQGPSPDASQGASAPSSGHLARRAQANLRNLLWTATPMYRKSGNSVEVTAARKSAAQNLNAWQ
jgi:hypothetical protein